MVSGRLFHKEGPMYDKVCCPVLVLRKGCLSYGKLFLVYNLLFLVFNLLFINYNLLLTYSDIKSNIDKGKMFKK